MSNNLVSQQIPVTSTQMAQLDPIPRKVDSSLSSMSVGLLGPASDVTVSQQLPVSNNQVVAVDLSGVPGLQKVAKPNEQFGLIEQNANNFGSHRFLVPSKQIGEIGNAAKSAAPEKSSISGKRKMPMGPLSSNPAQQQLSISNKRVAKMEHSQVSMPNRRAVQMQSKLNTPKSQHMSAQNKRIAHGESRSGRSGAQQLSVSKNQAQMQQSAKVKSESVESVRSKMRESLASALALVSQSPGKHSIVGQNSHMEAVASMGKSEDAQSNVSASAATGTVDSMSEKPKQGLASGEDVKNLCNDEIPPNEMTHNAMETVSCDEQKFQLGSVMPDEDISFSDNLFVRDELLQGNGLSWVLDPFTNDAVKDANTTENWSMGQGQQKEKDGREEVSQSPESLALRIEAELYKLYGGVNKKYKEKGRSLLFNLKDRNNPELRERVVSGEIPPERLCSMTAEELASKELSQWRIAKAEELAQMVVLPDSDVDVRRLVKKTHKGEFQVEVEQDDSSSVEVPLKTSSITQGPKNREVFSSASKSEETKDEVDVTSGNSSSKNVGNSCTLTIPPNEGSDLMDDALNDTENLPPIVSLDEFMQSLDSEPPFENLPLDTVRTPISDKNNSDVGSDYRASGSIVRNTEAQQKDPADASRVKGSKIESKSTKSTESHAASDKKPAPVPEGDRIWEGLVQLNISALTSIVGVFKSGDKTSAKEWPNPLEVKGRVRLDAFEKFLQDLPMSRSRAVMVVHFVCSSESGVESVREVADSYVLDGRVGFAEPAPGVELYFCPPHIKTLELLGKILPKDHMQELNTIDYGLIGIVVWRKAQLTSTISPTSASYSKHGSKKQHFSRRHQERDSNTNDKFARETSVARNQLHNASVPQPKNNDDDDDDIPPGFGPPAARDDDLPEFDFSGSNPQATPIMPSRGPYHGRQPPRPVDQMRELVQKYGRSGSVGALGSWRDDDDDDDIPEWQPQAPYSQPVLRPHHGNRPQLGSATQLQSVPPLPLPASLGLPEQSIQPPLNMLQGQQNMNSSRQQGSWGFPPSGSHGLQPRGGQFYGARGHSGPGWRRDAPSRGF